MMRPERPLRAVMLLSLLLTGIALPIRADYQISSTTFLPQQFYVGDRVEMRVSLRVSAGAELTVPEALPQVDWGDLHHVRLLPRGAEWEVRIVFTSFQPGTRTIAPLDLGAVTVSGLSVHIPSILEIEGRSEPAPPQDQMVLPGTRLWIALFALLLVLLPFFWIISVSRGRRYVHEFVRRYRERQPYRRLSRALKHLSASMAQTDGRAFYIALLEHIRRYLSTRLRTDCMSLTTSELDSHLDRLVPSAEDRRLLLELFRYGDLVKFASLAAPAEQRSSHIAQLRAVVEKLEQRRTPRQPRRRKAVYKRRRERVGV